MRSANTRKGRMLYNSRTRKQKGGNQMQNAIKRGNVSEVQTLLSRGFDINMEMNYNMTPLIAACYYRKKQIVELLLKIPKININAQDVSGNTALIIAIQQSQIDIINLLIDAPEIDINIQNKYGDTALIVAPRFLNATTIINPLLTIPGININAQNINKETALMVACESNNFEVAKRLLEETDINVNLQNNIGNSALLISCQKNNTKLIKILLEYPTTDILIKNDLGRNILLIASRIGYLDVVSFLIKMIPDMNLNIQDNYGFTPLMLALQTDSLKVAEFLLSIPDIDINIQNDNGETALMIAVMKNQIQIVELLLSFPDINIDIQDNNGNTVFEFKPSIEIEFILSKKRIEQYENNNFTMKPINQIKTYSNILNSSKRALMLKNIILNFRKAVGDTLEIKTLDEMPLIFPNVNSILIHPIGISKLPELPISLQYLNISGNPIQYLPKLPNKLVRLICSNCNLQELPQLPDSLEYLDARNNAIKDISKLPRKLILSPLGKLNTANNHLYSTNVLLTGNPLPIGLINGFGSITKYTKKHIWNIINYNNEFIHTMILPKGTLLFRNSNSPYNKEELYGIYDKRKDQFSIYPEFNVFFYPYPFVADTFISTNYLHIFELERDVEILLGVLPSSNTRSDRFNSSYLTTCDKIDTKLNDIKGHEYDPCFTQEFSSKHMSVAGMLVLAGEDTVVHINNDIYQRFWSKYRTNFIDNKHRIGIPEIILHPNSNRFDNFSPLNYKYVTSLKHNSYKYDEAWRNIEEYLSNGEWTIDMFTKFYVNYNSLSDEIKSRCVPNDEPYKLRYLNTDYYR